MVQFLNSEACGQTVLPHRSILIGQKLVENVKIRKMQMRHFGWFSNTVAREAWRLSIYYRPSSFVNATLDLTTLNTLASQTLRLNLYIMNLVLHFFCG